MTELTLNGKTVKVKPLAMEGKGFARRYRQFLAAQRAFTNPEKATPEDLDAAIALIASRVEGLTEDEIFDELNEEDLGELFAAIVGAENAVPPKKGGA